MSLPFLPALKREMKKEEEEDKERKKEKERERRKASVITNECWMYLSLCSVPSYLKAIT